MTLIENEQTKLTASFMNTLASGFVITGGLAPAVALILGAIRTAPWFFMVSGSLCVAAGVALHVAARRVLRRLR